MQFPTTDPTISAPPLLGYYWHPAQALQLLLDVSLASRHRTTCTNFCSPEELVATMAVLPESTAHALWLLNAYQSCHRHEYIKLSERRRVEEMELEALSDDEDGLETTGENL